MGIHRTNHGVDSQASMLSLLCTHDRRRERPVAGYAGRVHLQALRWKNSDFITRNWRSLVAHMLWEHGVVGSNSTFRIFWGISSVGRASTLQAEGRQFDSDILHSQHFKHDTCTVSTHHPSCFDCWFIQITDYKIQSPIRAV